MFQRLKPAAFAFSFLLMVSCGFANDIRITVNGLGHVTVNGTRDSDRLTLQSISVGGTDLIFVAVWGLSTFTFDGQTYDAFDGIVSLPGTSSSSNILLNVGDGDDIVALGGVKAKSVRALMGRGNDIYASNALNEALDVTIDGGPGDYDDKVEVNGIVSRNLRISLGAGLDECNLGNYGPLAIGGRLNITQFSGKAEVAISQTTVLGATSILLGASDDTVEAVLSTFASLNINLGPSQYSQTVDVALASVFGNFTVSGGLDSDWILLNYATFGGNVTLNSSSGNDRIIGNGVEFRRNATFNTGLGIDLIRLTSSSNDIFSSDSNVRMNTGPGSDNIEVDTDFLDTRSLSISTGAGNDDVSWSVFMTTTLVGPPRFIGGSGDDYLYRGNFNPAASIIGFETIAF